VPSGFFVFLFFFFLAFLLFSCELTGHLPRAPYVCGAAEHTAEFRRAKIEASLNNNPIGPLNQGDKDRGAPEFRVPVGQIGFRDPTGPGTGSS
jgi:hypothetical protein